MTDIPTAIAALPFTDAPLGRAARLWVVTSTGDWAADNRLGREYADAAVSCMKEQDVPNLLGHIVKAMRLSTAPWTGIEVGFFQRIAERLS